MSKCSSIQSHRNIFDSQSHAQVLNYFFEAVLPKAGVLTDDRALVKEALKSHSDYRDNSGGNNVAWQARLNKSGILIFELIEAGIFSGVSLSLFQIVEEAEK